MRSTVNSNEGSIYDLSREIRDKVIKNLPEDDSILFCFETRAEYYWQGGKGVNQDGTNYNVDIKGVNYYVGVITKHWLLSMVSCRSGYDPNNDDEESITLMRLSDVQGVKQASAFASDYGYSEEMPLIIVTGTKSIRFYFDTQRLMYKFEEVLKNAINKASPTTKTVEKGNTQKISSNQITINGNVSGSNIIIGNENKIGDS